ncbi:DsrE-like protein [Shewanella piezotolerans WP3]|uniref:DsrE-like protein n=1 Tax=Shewanella piezotolerans (strain WP3 / JCM 13877) TaxID=225849 RepID=B8CP37_SHEPW|nr:sulfurtransferase complex subunit TusC [Shewanella piezotolerans]ACJ29281.1 DsrE-like protein [Shewanella piezotolerans WP3]
MKKLCIVFSQGPHGNAKGREALDLALLSASFEQQVSLVFTDEGILNLLKNQAPETVGAKDYIATFGALPLYDIETILVCEAAMKELALTEHDIKLEVQFCSSQAIAEHFNHVDEVLVF